MSIQSAAILTVKKPGKMTLAGRRLIAKWLRARANNIEKHGDLYTDADFTARYIFSSRGK